MATQSYLLFVISFALIPFTSFAVTYAPLYVFGDGFYDSGNTYFLEGDANVSSHYPPYGMTFFDKPTGRFSDGRLIPDWIAMEMTTPFFQPALNQSADHSYGANFAVYGAGVFNTTYNDLETLRLLKQVEVFLDLNANNVSAAVYLINIGTNDYVRFVNQNPSATETELQEFVDSVIVELKFDVKVLYDKGGRKFMFQNLPPIGCFPAIKESDNCTEDTLSKLATLHNTALSQAAEASKTDFDGLEYSIFDYYNMFVEIISHPSNYHITYVDEVCCEDCNASYAIRCRHAKVTAVGACRNPSEYLFFDRWHHTDNINFACASEMWSGQTFVSPFNLLNLFELETTSQNNKFCEPTDNCSRKFANFVQK